jgi:hypothetical protein
VSLLAGISIVVFFVWYREYEVAVFIWILVGCIIKAVIFSSWFIESSLAPWVLGQSVVSARQHPTEDRIYGARSDTTVLGTSQNQNDTDLSRSTSFATTAIPTYTSETTSENNSHPPLETIPPEEPSKIGLYLHSFFSDRPLAKVGGILLFLGALFFLWLVFAAVGPVGKTLIGLAFGFLLIGIGVWLESRDIHIESRVLFGVGIAVNYLTILSGRHLLGSDIGSGALLSEWLTTIALLLNTGLAIVISLVFRSRVLLGFAFIFAYLIPFLVGSTNSSVILLVIYTTILTVAISIINTIYQRLAESDSIAYLQWIGISGMTILLALATIDASATSVMMICGGLFVSTIWLVISSYRAKLSLVPVLAAWYIVLFVSTFVVSSYFIVPLSLVVFLGLWIWLVFHSLISVVSIVVFGGIAFAMSLIGFIVDGGQSIGILFMTGSCIFMLLGILLFRTASLLLGSIALLGFAWLTLIGITVADPVDIDISTIISTRVMALLLLIWGSMFTIRLREALYFLMSILLSGILVLYPDTFIMSNFVTVWALVVYGFISFIVPYILMDGSREIAHRAALLISLPVSTLVITTAIYQIGHIVFPGLAMGVAYIVQAVIYLIYGMIISSRIIPVGPWDIMTLPATQKTDLLVLFALPLSLFTLALAFVFGDLPGMMSLAWILESTILYLVYTRISDIRIYIAACLIFLIGIARQIILIDSLIQGDYLSLAILAIMMVAVCVSLYLLRSQKHHSRILYDILHIGAMCGIGYGISMIIPSTSHGWSLLGMSTLILILSGLYRSFGQLIHRQFLSVILVLFCLLFISRFDTLNKSDILPLMIQLSSLGITLAIGYSGYRSWANLGLLNLAISLLATLFISSFYIDYFFGIFVVSIYLTAIAALVIIRGISTDTSLFRTIGLYIGTLVLVKILFYDLWQDDLAAITRVVALMIAGGVMMYLSQLYGKYVSRSWQQEFSFSNIFSTGSGDTTTPSEDSSHREDPEDIPDINPFTGELGIELTKMDVSQIVAVEFVSQSGSFTIKRSGVIRLAWYITDSLHKTVFAPGELTSAQNYVLGYLSSNLPARELTSLLAKISIWIQEGGSIHFISK